MPRATLSPGFVKLFQTTTISTIPLDHVQTLGIKPGTWGGTGTDIIRRSGATVIWSTAVGELVALLRPLFNAATVWTHAELWRMDTPTSDPTYVATHFIALAGSSVGAAQTAVQNVINFKGDDDSDMRFTMIENVQVHNRRIAYAAMATQEKALADYIIGATSWLYTRGNAYPASVGLLTSKVNDVVRKQRLNL